MRVLLLCSRSFSWRLRRQLSLHRHLLLLRGRLGRRALLCPDDGSGSDSDSDSSSESGDESESEMEFSAGPVAPWESSPDLPSRENLSVVQRAQVNQK